MDGLDLVVIGAGKCVEILIPTAPADITPCGPRLLAMDGRKVFKAQST